MQPKTQNSRPNYEEYKDISEFRYLGLLVTYDNDLWKRCPSKNNSRE
jgi:hypothetical protein